MSFDGACNGLGRRDHGPVGDRGERDTDTRATRCNMVGTPIGPRAPCVRLDHRSVAGSNRIRESFSNQTHCETLWPPSSRPVGIKPLARRSSCTRPNPKSRPRFCDRTDGIARPAPTRHARIASKRSNPERGPVQEVVDSPGAGRDDDPDRFAGILVRVKVRNRDREQGGSDQRATHPAGGRRCASGVRRHALSAGSAAASRPAIAPVMKHSDRLPPLR